MNQRILSIKKRIIPALKEFKVKRADIFGSYARGEQKSGSDIDIAVILPNNLSLLGVIKLQNKMEDILKKKVDLIEYKEIHPKIKKSILKERIRII